MIVSESLTEYLIRPVSTGLSARIRRHRSYFITCESIRICRIDSICIISCIFKILNELRTVHHTQGLIVRHGSHTGLTVIRNGRPALLSTLGRDDDHSVRRTRAIERSRSGILQHRHGFDIFRIDGVEHTHAFISDLKV